MLFIPGCLRLLSFQESTVPLCGAGQLPNQKKRLLSQPTPTWWSCRRYHEYRFHGRQIRPDGKRSLATRIAATDTLLLRRYAFHRAGSRWQCVSGGDNSPDIVVAKFARSDDAVLWETTNQR